jgi:hypothetical protein
MTDQPTGSPAASPITADFSLYLRRSFAKSVAYRA